MKKLTVMFAALLASVSMFASKEVAPKAADLANYYDPGQLCVAVYFEEEVCNDVVFVGTYNGWATTPADMAKFEPVEDFDGWWVVAVTDESEVIEGKPVQLQSDGSFSWDYQTGDVDSWTLVSGTVNISAGYSGEAHLEGYSTAEPVVLISAYFKNHNSPCVPLVPHTYTVNLKAPICGSDPNDYSTYFAPAIIGDFNNWAEGVAMELNEETMVYSYTFDSFEGKQFKFKAAGDIDWTNQIQILIDGDWYDNQNIMLADQETINIDYSNGRYTLCNMPAIPGTTLPLYDFESASTNADWVLVNGTQTNQWTIGSATALDSNHSLYISNNGSDYGYNNEASSVVWAYINTPITGDVNISFDWKGYGEGSYDYMRAYLVPAASIGDLYAGSEYTPDGCISLGTFNAVDSWLPYFYHCLQLTENYYLAFMWRNDGSAGEYPIAIDNIQVQGLTYETYQVSITAGDNGYLSTGNVVGTFTDNCNAQRIEVCAYPEEHYKFIGWSDGITDECRSIYLTQDLTIVAMFEAKKQYTVLLGVDNSSKNMGTVSGSGRYDEDDIVTITATPNNGYHFVEWSDGNSNATRDIRLTSDTTLFATFAKGNYGGKCGESLYWTLEEGALTITGTGDMDLDTHPAWWQYENLQITSVSMPEGMTSIYTWAFYEQPISTVIVPASVERIGDRAFAYNDQLIHFEYLGNNIHWAIGEGDWYHKPLYGCGNLQYFRGNKDLLAWVDYYGSLDTVIISNGEAWDYWYSATYVDNTNATDEIIEGEYDHVNVVQTLYLPAGLVEIGDYALQNARFLGGITIPEGVTRIGISAFEDCRSMESVTFAGKKVTEIGAWAFYNCHNLSRITLPEGVEEIGTAAFYGCTFLSELTIPSTTKKIAQNGFALCSKMQKMYVNALVPPSIESKTFEDVDRATPVFVPQGTIERYQADPYWSEFFNMTEYEAPMGNLTPAANETNTLRKVLRNGQVFILRGEKTYDLIGQEVE